MYRPEILNAALNLVWPKPKRRKFPIGTTLIHRDVHLVLSVIRNLLWESGQFQILRERPYRSSSLTNGVMCISVCCVVTFNVKLKLIVLIWIIHFMNYLLFRLFIHLLIYISFNFFLFSIHIETWDLSSISRFDCLMLSCSQVFMMAR